MKRGTRKRRGGHGRGGQRRSWRGRAAGISDLTAQRLSVYLRCLDDLEKSEVTTISSQRLADRYQLNSAQIRKDLAYFGEFGVRGVGYKVADLREALARILGLTRQWKVVIIGAGNLGMALADYGGFNREGFAIIGLFDNDPAKMGTRSRGGVPVHDIRTLPDRARAERIGLAILAVPASEAGGALAIVERSGIRGVLNFAPVRLRPRSGTTLKAVDLKIQLENLVFHLTRGEGAAAARQA